MPAIITENDESQWADDTGVVYHFPKRYKKLLLPGTEVIYYKGKLRRAIFREKRLSDLPHYFAKATIGKVYMDVNSSKGDLFGTIENYQEFEEPILAKVDDEYLEHIPQEKKSNYWRDGVRQINDDTYSKILSNIKTTFSYETLNLSKVNNEINDFDNTLESIIEGQKSQRFVTIYERNPKLKKQAIAIHGNSCHACGFNFGNFYGAYADGYIHIHHVTPVSELLEPKHIDPEVDLIPLCANCHSVVHRRKDKTLTIEELKVLIKGNT
ncbi:MAG: HNH endonuclease [Pseudoalteromonas sp.]|uniref:HNH endonuclease n=1 Tax=Pseudoalteromonas sp. TaxID=53249 RepID=UPI00384DB53E